MNDRCTGHCCECFWLPWDHTTLIQRADRLRDGHQISRMVIPISSPSPEAHPFIVPLGVGGAFYTCQHYTDGQCTIYADRPAMCREYPYDKRCLYAGCTWSLRKGGLPVLLEGGAP